MRIFFSGPQAITNDLYNRYDFCRPKHKLTGLCDPPPEASEAQMGHSGGGMGKHPVFPQVCNCIIYTFGCISRKAVPLAEIECFCRADKPYSADGDKIVGVVCIGIVFVYDVCHQPQVVLDERVSCIHIAVGYPFDADLFLFFRELLWKKVTVFKMQSEEEQVF